MGALMAAPIDPQTALERLERFAPEIKRHAPAAQSRLLETKYDSKGEAALYVFTYSGNEGFMILSADDAVVPLLGYSETGTFRSGEGCENLEGWLQGYTLQIEDARTLPPYAGVLKTRAEGWPAIEPMVKTEWDQTAPYNNLCPVYENRRCVTGCVATAMAQIMKYWEYPSSGKGTISYYAGDISQDLNLDLSSITFDWANMQNRYGGTSSSQSQRAVAQLMQACGYSVKMNYSPRTSGALSRDVHTAFLTYFGYDSEVSLVSRYKYSQDDWNKLIYDELANVGPVLYSGQSTSGGHAFVCDGYDGNGYYHINWGWSGMSNGYFLLNELTPHQIGTGGHYGGYNMQQEAVIGIMPPAGRLTVESMAIDNAADDSGNVKGLGYTYRINEFSNIVLSMRMRVTGGVFNSPIFMKIYETDPETKQNGALVYDGVFNQVIKENNGAAATYTTSLNIKNYDPAKLYTLVVSYTLKNQTTTVGTLRLAASSGVGSVYDDGADLTLRHSGRMIEATASEEVTLAVYDLNGVALRRMKGVNPSLALDGLTPGVYVAIARTETGARRVLKLHLR